MKKKKHLKIFAASSLALIMSAGVLCGVLVPVGATSASSAANLAGVAQSPDRAQSESLITPKENDPVIFTTESGVEIKWGNAATGNLANFPYFETDDKNTTFTWVVIGESLSKPIKNLPSSTRAYMRNNGESENVAFNAIYNDENLDKSWYIKNFLNSLNSNKEIPEGCVLCLANDFAVTGVANNTVKSGYYDMFGYEKRNYHSYYVGALATTMDDYYTNGDLGLFAIKELIQPISLTTYGREGGTSNGNTFSWTSNTTTSYVFPLASSKNSSSFMWSTYLTATQMKLSSNQWLRDGVNDTSSNAVKYGSSSNQFGYYTNKYYMDSSGTEGSKYVNETALYRPAFVLKLI